jgi:hypothetical protein
MRYSRRVTAPLCVGGLAALLLLALGGLLLDARVLLRSRVLHEAAPPRSAATTAAEDLAANRAWRLRLGNDGDDAGVELSAQWRVLFCPSSQTPWSFHYLQAAWLRASELLNVTDNADKRAAAVPPPAAPPPVLPPPSPPVPAPYPPRAPPPRERAAPPPHPQQPAAAAAAGARLLHNSDTLQGGSVDAKQLTPKQLTSKQLRTMRAFYRWFPGASSGAVLLSCVSAC